MDENLSEAYNAPMDDKVKNRKRWMLGAAVILVVLAIAYLVGFLLRSTESDKISATDFRSSLEMSVAGTDPKPLQDYFAGKVAAGEKDDEAKSAIYWITHRYFDNGGDIYEIYDFIQARPELAFLNEAELIYPPIFDLVKNRQVTNYSVESLMALLAYYEIIDLYGYAGIGVWGIAANQYAELARVAKFAYERDVTAATNRDTLRALGQMQDKSRMFVDLASEWLVANTAETYSLNDLNSLNMIPDDLLVGLNQYGAALENLRGVGITIGTMYSAGDIYEFNYALVAEQVPRLYFFTNYLHASSLVAGGTATSDNVALPLSRALAYARDTDPAEWRGSVYRVIESRNTTDTAGMYAPATAKKLANLNQEFKGWLLENGWVEADFR